MIEVKREVFGNVLDAALALLTDEEPRHVNELFRKLMELEGVSQPADLTSISHEALQMRLVSTGKFTLGDIATVNRLRSLLLGEGADVCDDAPRGSGAGRAGRRDEHRSRSPLAQNRQWSHRASSRPLRTGKGGGGGRHGGGGHGRSGGGSWRRGRSSDGGRHRGGRAPAEKPELWAAAEHGDLARVTRLLEEGRSAEERYQGWTPLMKAAEEDHGDICRELVNRRADLEAQNSKGRTALSFAAAPSKRGQGAQAEARPTAMNALRVLLAANADPLRKDMRGSTARQRAEGEDRFDAVELLQEYEATRR